jgi:hypothetical protein
MHGIGCVALAVVAAALGVVPREQVDRQHLFFFSGRELKSFLESII